MGLDPNAANSNDNLGARCPTAANADKLADGWRMIFGGAVSVASFYLEKQLSKTAKPAASPQQA